MENKDKKITTISACLMVKNEERFLAQCLESIKDQVDEIIIVDTGSTDTTVSIAESYGAKVYHHPWEDHFSKHRNQTMEYATCEWCLIIDADEELLHENGISLRAEIKKVNADIDSLMVVVENASDHESIIPTNSVRIVRNSPNILYKGRVHNYLTGIKKAISIPVRFFHYGYNLGTEMNERKFERTTRLLELDIQEDPENPRPYHFMAVSHLTCKLHQSAAEYAEKAIRLFEKSRLVPHNYLWCLFVAANSHLELGNLEKAEAFSKKGISFFSDHLDSHYVLCACYMLQNDSRFWHHKDCFFDILNKIKKNPEEFGEIVQNTFPSAWKVAIWAGVIALEEGDIDIKDKELANAKRLSPNDYTFHLELGHYLKYKKYFHEAEGEFQMALELEPDKSRPYLGLIDIYAKTGNKNSQVSLLDQFLSGNCFNINDSILIASIANDLKHTGHAKAILQKVLGHEPDNTDAKLILGNVLIASKEYEQAKSLAGELIKPNGSLNIQALSLLARSNYFLGEDGEALDAFFQITQTEPDLLEPHVYAADISLRLKDIESCVNECDELLRILDLDRNIMLNSLPDLGGQFFRVAESLVEKNETGLMKQCLQIGKTLMLGQAFN